KIFCTTMGAATDLASEGLRRLIVNAVYWGVGLDVPRRANVDTVGEFRPTPYGFDGFQRGLRPSDFELVTVDNARRDETVDASANSANRGAAKLAPSA